MLGENHIPSDENLVWIMRSHYPIQMPRKVTYDGNKQFVLVRNPVDAIPSYIYLGATVSHQLAPTKPVSETHPEDWDYLMREVEEVYRAFCKMHRENVSKKIPTYYMRYEDLCTRPKEILAELFSFVLNVKSIEGTVVEKRINDLMDTQAMGKNSVYALKKG